MHFSAASTDTLALKNAIDANVTTAMWQGCSLGTGVYQLSITPLDGSSATQIYSVSGTKWAGGGTAADYIPAAAAVVSLRTAKRGRRYRGRVYIPYPSETLCANGSFTATPSSAQTAWDAFRSAMATALFPMVVATYGHSLHRTKNPGGGYTLTPVTWTPDSTPVTATTVEQALGTQRRRQSRLR